MTPKAAQQVVSLETAARMTRDTGLATWVIVKRTPGVADKARCVARQLEVAVEVVIDSGTIAVRFTKLERRSTR